MHLLQILYHELSQRTHCRFIVCVMSSGPDLGLYEILLPLKKSNLDMSVLYYALNFLGLVKVCLFVSDLSSVTTRKQLHLC